eukprot:533469-Rhodomonas_salina.3
MMLRTKEEKLEETTRSRRAAWVRESWSRGNRGGVGVPSARDQAQLLFWQRAEQQAFRITRESERCFQGWFQQKYQLTDIFSIGTRILHRKSVRKHVEQPRRAPHTSSQR